MNDLQFRVVLLFVMLFSSIVFFSTIFRVLVKSAYKVSNKIGAFSISRELKIQRYVFIHRESMVSKGYNWINKQLGALGLKRYGVTPFGYFLFWCFVSLFVTFVTVAVLGLGLGYVVFLFFIFLVFLLTGARVYVSSKLEKRELDVMDAVDLLIPDIASGTKNSIMRYSDNFADSVKYDFKEFLANIDNRGYSFEDAMYMLTDSLGDIFRDFANRAIYYELSGEPDATDMSDLVELNRLRRRLKFQNKQTFATLRSQFTISVGMTVAYAIFILSTDEFSRDFFLSSVFGNILLLIVASVPFIVLSYLALLRSRTL